MLKKFKDNISQFSSKLKGVSTKHAINIMGKIIKNSSPQQSVNMMSVLEFIAPNKELKEQMSFVKKDFAAKGPWWGLLTKFFTNVNSNCREKLIHNLVVNHSFGSEQKRKEFFKKEKFMPPAFIVISPSMTCNIHCFGCYASEYSKKDDLPFEVFDRVINEAKEMGTHFFTISGGEPFFNKDVFKIFAKHDDCYFLVYTNGTLIDQKLAKKLAKLGNVAPAISVEGFEKETDKRRGKGAWKRINDAMDNLKKEGVIFGFSATPTRINSDILASEKFVDYFIKKGCMFGWFFQYIPIGRKPDVELMATPKQRNELRKFIHNFVRVKKSIFIGDFWNDGPMVGGCMAGGSLYLHINVRGDVEPCVFTHFAVDNIKNKPLKECLKSKFFKVLRDRVQSTRAAHPSSDNLLTPCAIIDNPQVLRDCVREGNARPTHDGAETIICDKKIIKHLDNYSKEYHALVDSVWKKDYCKKCSKGKK